MKWKVRKPGTKVRAFHLWHVWFAWYPVRIPTKGRGSGQKKVWLENVRRKGHLHSSWGDSWWQWYYEEIVEE